MNFLSENDPRRLVWLACESPIEQMLCCGLFAILGCKAVHDPYRLSRRLELASLAGADPAAFAFSQHWIQSCAAEQKYRADFLVVLVDPLLRKSKHFIIECDGKNFHTGANQVRHDEQRDAEILAAGYHSVLRFTGSDIHRSFDWCLSRIGRVLADFGFTPIIPNDCAFFAEFLVKTYGNDRGERRRLREQASRQQREEAEVDRIIGEDLGYDAGVLRRPSMGDDDFVWPRLGET